MNFGGRTVIITGAGSGMGRSHAIAFAKEGAKVVLMDNRREPLLKTAKKIKDLGAEVLAVGGDVSSQGDVEQMVSTTLRKFGTIDVLVNNAGIFRYGEVEEFSESEWDRVMAVNVKGVFLCSKAVVKQMIRQGKGGRIINISSTAGKMGMKNVSAYCASKFAVIGFTQALAKEVGKHKILVNAICPGTIYETDMAYLPGGYIEMDMKVAGETDKEKMKEYYEQRIPLGRVGRPEDVTKVVLFLASNSSNYLTGQSINVDGGDRFSF